MGPKPVRVCRNCHDDLRSRSSQNLLSANPAPSRRGSSNEEDGEEFPKRTRSESNLSLAPSSPPPVPSLSKPKLRPPSMTIGGGIDSLRKKVEDLSMMLEKEIRERKESEEELRELISRQQKEIQLLKTQNSRAVSSEAPQLPSRDGRPEEL